MNAICVKRNFYFHYTQCTFNMPHGFQFDIFPLCNSQMQWWWWRQWWQARAMADGTQNTQPKRNYKKKIASSLAVAVGAAKLKRNLCWTQSNRPVCVCVSAPGIQSTTHKVLGNMVSLLMRRNIWIEFNKISNGFLMDVRLFLFVFFLYVDNPFSQHAEASIESKYNIYHVYNTYYRSMSNADII